MRFFSHLPIVFLLFCITCCKEDARSNLPNEESNKQYQIKIADISLSLELARLPKQRELGLMHRERLNEKEGMLFIFENPQPQRFWMKNTRIPLDIGYFSEDGRLKELYQGRPFDLTGLASQSNSLQFVVELGAGEFARLGIRLGDRLDLEMVIDAIIASGGNPTDYNLIPPRR
ncbi:MAG: DUF192 domain-containing protein [Opitutae bacterium]